MKKILCLLKNYHYLFGALIFNIAESVSRNYISIYMGLMIEVLIFKNINECIRYLYNIFLISCILFLSVFLKDLLLSIYLENGIRNLRNRIINGIYDAQFQWIDKYGTGKLLGRMNSDVQELNNSLRPVLISGFSALISFVITFVFLFSLNYILCFLLVGFSILVSLLNWGLSKKIENIKKGELINDTNISNFLTNCSKGKDTIKYLSIQYKLKMQFCALLDSRRYLEKEENIIISSIQYLSSILKYLPQIMICLIGTKYINSTITIGNLVAIYILSGNISSFINNLPIMIEALKSVVVASCRVLQLVDAPSEKRTGKFKECNLDKVNAIEFKNVNFLYDKKDLLKDLNFVIKKGSFNIIYGESGRGKTSLFKLICGFYPPNAGEISLFGTNIFDLKIKDLRDCISYVTQESCLFETSIKNNISSFDEKVDNEKIEYVMRKVNLMEELVDSSGSFDISI